MDISIVLCTFNPNLKRLQITLNALDNQTLPYSQWELIIVDNNSTNNNIYTAYENIKITNKRIVNQPRQGLTWARLKGFSEAKGDIIVMVDDDNELDKNYLENVIELMSNNPRIGATGGISEGVFECDVPDFVYLFLELLAIRDFGNEFMTYSTPMDSEFNYPYFAPIGAGMAIKAESLKSYINYIESNDSAASDRTGNNLSSSGDNDIVIHILKSGYEVSYTPDLVLKHHIPKERLTVEYLASLNEASSKSWHSLLLQHNISPWMPIPQWTLPLRILKAYYVYKPWTSNVNYIKWKGACGHFKGRLIKKS